MIYVKIILLIILTLFALFCVKQVYRAFVNLMALLRYKKNPDSLPQHQDIVFNKKTGKLETDNSPILPYD